VTPQEIKQILVEAGYPSRAVKVGEYSCAISKNHAHMEHDVARRLEKTGWKEHKGEVAYGGYSGYKTLVRGEQVIVVSQGQSKPVSVSTGHIPKTFNLTSSTVQVRL